MMKKFFLIDTLALAYKSYFAFITRPLVNSKAENISVVYGFLNFLINLLIKNKPDYIAAAFDSKEKTFRHLMFDKYKSRRQIMPEDLIVQVEKIKDILRIMKIPVVIMPGYEADDLIGSITNQFKAKDLEFFLLTPDKDYFQLINEKTFIYKPGKKTSDAPEIINTQKAEELYGIKLEYFLDYFALIGDKSDDIPGVKGIGEVEARNLINKFGTLENIYANLDKIERKAVRKYLEENKELAFLSRELVKIKSDIVLNYRIDDFKFGDFNLEELKKYLNNLEIRSLLAKIDELVNSSNSLFSDRLEFNKESSEVTSISINKEKVSERQYQIIDNISSLKKLIEELNKKDKFVFDTETNELDYHNANLIGLSVAFKENEAYFINFRDLDDKNKENYIELLEIVFNNPKILKIGHNLKFDLNILRKNNIKFSGELFDTMIASYVLNPDGTHSIDALAKNLLNVDKIKLTELIGNKKDASLMNVIDINKITEYSCEDADITYRLYEIFDAKLKEKELVELCKEIEFPLIDVLAKMEYNGVYIDTKELKLLSYEIERKLIELEEKIYEISGGVFNINSPKQLQEILFKKLNLQPLKKTKTGVSTDYQTLELLRDVHPIINYLIDYRKLIKLKSTYIDALPKLINPKTGRVHTSYNQAITVTGRLSSSNPNLQNIPIHGELGKEIRKAFVPQNSGWKILSADYSQIELRIMASLSNDEKMIEAFRNNIDIHSNTASLIYNCSLNEITPDMRRKAKEVNFGILYGIGPHGLKTRLGISQQQAKKIIDDYFKAFPKIKNYISETISFAQKYGYVETLKKRRRYLPNINSKNFTVKSFEERAAINMPVQGTASDLIKIAMINIQKRLDNEKLKSFLIMQVHDELVFELFEPETEVMKKIIKEEMENAIQLSVPITVDIGIGDNWLEAH